jgi:ketosteroid isomerase-like protein
MSRLGRYAPGNVSLVASALLVLATAGALAAHDFWLVPNAFAIQPGDAVTVLGQTSSRFPTSESAVTTERVAEARLIGARIDTRIDDLAVAGKSLRLRARPADAGQYLVAAALHWRSMRESAQSFRRYLELEGAPAALERIDREGLLKGRDSVTRRYAKYAKTLVQVGAGGDRAFAKVVGHPLEFVPERDPASLRTGDTLTVRLILLGQPAHGARVHAGSVRWIDGRSTADSAAAGHDHELTADASGRIRVPIGAPGVWNIRTIQIVQTPRGLGADWDAHWATLVFLVPGADRAGMPQSRDSADVAATVQAYDRALSTGDSTAALALLAPDAVILESGGIETREEYRSHHLPGDIAFARGVPSQGGPVTVRVRGDVAWAWSTSTTQGEFRGRQINSSGAELMVLTRTAAGWKIAAIHWSSRTRRP